MTGINLFPVEAFKNLPLHLFQGSFKFAAKNQPLSICILKYLFGIRGLNVSHSLLCPSAPWLHPTSHGVLPPSFLLWGHGSAAATTLIPAPGKLEGNRFGVGRHITILESRQLGLAPVLLFDKKWEISVESRYLSALNVILFHKGIFRADSWRSPGSHHKNICLMLLQHKVSLPRELKPWKYVMRCMWTWHMGLWYPQKQFADPGPLLKSFTYRYCLFTAKCRNSSYTFFPAHAGRGLKLWPGQRLLHLKNIWKHRSKWMELQPGHAVCSHWSYSGHSSCRTGRGSQKLLSWILSRPCLTHYLSSSFTGLSCQGSGGEKCSSKSCLLSCWMNNFEWARSVYKDENATLSC